MLAEPVNGRAFAHPWLAMTERLHVMRGAQHEQSIFLFVEKRHGCLRSLAMTERVGSDLMESRPPEI